MRQLSAIFYLVIEFFANVQVHQRRHVDMKFILKWPLYPRDNYDCTTVFYFLSKKRNSEFVLILKKKKIQNAVQIFVVWTKIGQM